MPEERNNHEYRTNDLGLAAYLCCKGHTHQRLHLRGRKTVIFVFDRNAALDDLVRAFQCGEATVEPIAYQKSLTEARRDLFDFLDGAAA